MAWDEREYQCRYREKNREKLAAQQRERHARKRFGISRAEYEQRKKAQGGASAICEETPPPLHLDHNHATGALREMLCGPCNQGLGLFREDPDLLRAATDYLGRHSR